MLDFIDAYNKILNQNNQKEIIEQGVGKLATGFLAAFLLATSAMGGVDKVIDNAKEGTKIQQQAKNTRISSKDEVANLATKFLIHFEGSIKDKDGKHIAYDDSNNKNRFNSDKQTFEQWLKTCKGTATIGYGETKGAIVREGSITQSEAQGALRDNVNKIYDICAKKFGKVWSKMDDFKKASLISLYYNLGTDFSKTPKLVKAIEEERWEDAAKEFLDCNKTTINGKKVESKGLTTRRQKESNYFLYWDKVDKRIAQNKAEKDGSKKV